MEKKIGLNIEENVKKELSKRKIVKLKISDETYSTRIKYKVSTEDKTQLLQNLYDLVDEFGEEIPFFVAMVISILQVTTDINFPEKGEEKLRLFTLLSDGGYLEEIFKAIPDQVLEDIGSFTKGIVDYTPDMIKKIKIEQMEQEKENMET